MTTAAAAATVATVSCFSSSSLPSSSALSLSCCPNRIHQRPIRRISSAGEPNSISSIRGGTRNSISCQVALKPDASSSSSSSSVSAAESEEETEEEKLSKSKIGSRVRVKGPELKVYHIPKVPEMDIAGMEGEIKQYVALWKGKRISANFPFKVEFFTEIEGRGRVKFLAHLREDEFEYI